MIGQPWEGPLSWSLLKHVHECPAKFLQACRRPPRPSAPGQILGTLVHRGLLGGPEPLVWEGDRRGNVWECVTAIVAGEVLLVGPPDLTKRAGKAWTEHKALAADAGSTPFLRCEWDEAGEVATEARDSRRSIVTRAESDAARRCIDAVRKAQHNAVAREWLGLDSQGYPDGSAKYETPLDFTFNGFEFRTRGVDVVLSGPPGIVELKTGPSCPHVALWQARKELHWHQLALYDHAVSGSDRFGEGGGPERWGIVSVETVDPWVATVLTMPELGIVDCRKQLLEWTDTLRVCIERGVWPGYASEPVEAPFEAKLEGLELLGEVEDVA